MPACRMLEGVAESHEGGQSGDLLVASCASQRPPGCSMALRSRETKEPEHPLVDDAIAY